MSAHILIAEADERQAQALRMYLRSKGHEATIVRDGRTAVETARRLRPDLLVLDAEMPKVGDHDACRIPRQESDVPILMLTARSGEDDLLLGHRLGADDRVTKPYSPCELMARVGSLLRRVKRSTPAPDAAVLRVGPITVDPLRQEVVGPSGHQVARTGGEVHGAGGSGLRARAGVHPRAASRPAPGPGLLRVGTTAGMYMVKLRRKLEPDPRRPQYLITVHGIGYKPSPGAGSGADGAGPSPPCPSGPGPASALCCHVGHPEQEHHRAGPMTGHVGGTGFAATTGCRRTAATTGRSADDVPTDRHRTTTAGHAPARTVAGSTWRPGPKSGFTTRETDDRD
ncbi:response regulator, partial [Streptomyces coelicoflavus]|uniref:response regulator n=1 Tax=Streptomyces coelicoflavus TaxID=285562 RepID=UPI003F4A848E